MQNLLNSTLKLGMTDAPHGKAVQKSQDPIKKWWPPYENPTQNRIFWTKLGKKSHDPVLKPTGKSHDLLFYNPYNQPKQAYGPIFKQTGKVMTP